MSDEMEIQFFNSDDPEMSQAVIQAQRSFRWFWYQVASDFNRIVPATNFSMIKAAFCNDFGDPNQTVEHMFVDSLYFDGVEIHGVLRSDPNWVHGIQDGDQVSFALKHVSDWMCCVDEMVYGGFAVQVIRSRMSDSERAAHDEAWGLPFPDVGTHHIPERSEKFELMISEHLKTALQEDASIVSSTDESKRTPLHNEALYGRLETTKVLLEHGADAKARCDRGWTPADYADAVGWTEVRELFDRS